jgi:UDP-N-acetylglucosamine--N-acetylmuramyl-(pentapeptide) pyrophosphoryl-undecaprenol N-acetylglucosamine transferase
MDAPRRLSFVSYAVNGAGVGHVVRQVAIQKWLRRLCAFCGTKSEHWFLTTSEADAVVFREGFAAFKLPSKTIVEAAGVDKLAYLALAKQWVWNSLALLRPDALLVDTFPGGSFHELGAALDLVHRKVLVLRPVKQSFARQQGRDAWRALVGAYDRVVVPEHEEDVGDDLDDLGVSPGRVVFTGPVMRGDRSDVLPRAEARARLGVREGDAVVLVTGGGGGDGGVDAVFDDVERALRARGWPHDDAGGHASGREAARRGVHVVWGAGPLFRGRPRHGPRATWFSGHDLFEHAAAVDVAIAAGGFNTVHELLWLGVPTIVAPQDKIADDQAARAARYAARGALVHVARDPGDRDALARAALALLDDDSARRRLAAAARAAVPDNHARVAAAAALGLLVPPSLVRAASEQVDEALCEGAQALGAPLGDVVDLALALQGQGDRAAVDARAALATATAAQAAPATVARVVEQLRKKARVDDVAPLAVRLLQDRAIDGQHAALVALLSALLPERHVDGTTLVDAIVATAQRAADAGVDLGTLARLLPQTVAVDGGLTGNLARLQAAVRSEAATTARTLTSSSSEAAATATTTRMALPARTPPGRSPVGRRGGR